eukprot:tig00021036_g17341.t1
MAGGGVLARLRGAAFVLHLWIASLLGSILVLFPACIVLWPISKTLYRRWARIWARAWFALVAWHLEVVNGVAVRVTGDEIPHRESALVILNHPSECDWFFSWSLALRFGDLASVKIMLKRTLVAVPGFGWGMLGFEYLFVERRWHGDKERIRKTLGGLCRPRALPLFLVVFPEGTDWKQHKLEKCHAYAKKANWRSSFSRSSPSLFSFRALGPPGPQPTADASDDGAGAPRGDAARHAVAYGPRGAPVPSPLAFAAGRFPSEIHLHVQRFPIDSVPDGEAAVKDWLMARFAEKDRLLEGYHSSGRFPGPVPSSARAPSRALLTLNAAVWTAVLAAAARALFAGGPFALFCGAGALYFSLLTWRTGWRAAGPHNGNSNHASASPAPSGSESDAKRE